MHRGTRRGRPSRTRAGISLVEIALAVTVFAVGAGASVLALLGALDLARTARETRRATESAESVIELMHALPFREVFARFNADPLDDPVGGPSPGNTFNVRGLDAAAGDPDGFSGEVVFPGDGLELSEDFVDAGLGTPRDLNLDPALAIDNIDHALDYLVLPVRVRVTWRGAGGAHSVELVTTLNNLDKP